MTSDDFNALAWRDFILWAWDSAELREQFTAETHINLPPATSQIETAMDQATGAAASRANAFVEWVTREHWGLEHAPAAYQTALAARAPVASKKKPPQRGR